MVTTLSGYKGMAWGRAGRWGVEGGGGGGSWLDAACPAPLHTTVHTLRTWLRRSRWNLGSAAKLGCCCCCPLLPAPASGPDGGTACTEHPASPCDCWPSGPATSASIGCTPSFAAARASTPAPATAPAPASATALARGPGIAVPAPVAAAPASTPAPAAAAPDAPAVAAGAPAAPPRPLRVG